MRDYIRGVLNVQQVEARLSVGSSGKVSQGAVLWDQVAVLVNRIAPQARPAANLLTSAHPQGTDRRGCVHTCRHSSGRPA